jgi:hypothetical protein
MEGVICGARAVFDCLIDGTWLVFREAAGGLGTRSEGGCINRRLEAVQTSWPNAGARLSLGMTGNSLSILKTRIEVKIVAEELQISKNVNSLLKQSAVKFKPM